MNVTQLGYINFCNFSKYIPKHLAKSSHPHHALHSISKLRAVSRAGNGRINMDMWKHHWHHPLYEMQDIQTNLLDLLKIVSNIIIFDKNLWLKLK